jgi:hypothetical protein
MSRIHALCPYPRFGRAALLAAFAAAGLALVAAGPASAHHQGRPHKPRDVRVVDSTTTSITLRWDRTTRRYRLRKGVNWVARTIRVRHEFRRLECGRTYRLGVRAVDRRDRLSVVASEYARTRPCPPPPEPDPEPVPEPDPDPGPSTPASPPALVQAPAVVGTPQVGNLLTASRGTWSGTAPLTYAYRWLRCDGAGANCADIASATGSSYRLASADATRTIRVRVTTTNAAGQATATSDRTAVVTAPPPPPPSGPGTTLTVTDARWVCDRPLSSYGPLPIRLEHRISNAVSAGLQNGAVRLEGPCTGDGNPATTDLVLHIYGNGADQGSASDGLVLVGAHDIEIEGFVNCGRPGGGAHQDGVQMNRAYRLTFRGFESGNWNAQTATCHGAGGVFYVSELNDNPANLVDVVCEGCRMVGSTQGPTRAGSALSIYGSTRSGARNSCFSANIPLAGPRSDSVAPIETGNLFIKRNSTGQPSPSACPVS